MMFGKVDCLVKRVKMALIVFESSVRIVREPPDVVEKENDLVNPLQVLWETDEYHNC
jgi:hypothetical protein